MIGAAVKSDRRGTRNSSGLSWLRLVGFAFSSPAATASPVVIRIRGEGRPRIPRDHRVTVCLPRQAPGRRAAISTLPKTTMLGRIYPEELRCSAPVSCNRLGSTLILRCDKVPAYPLNPPHEVACRGPHRPPSSHFACNRQKTQIPCDSTHPCRSHFPKSFLCDPSGAPVPGRWESPCGKDPTSASRI